MKIEALRDQLRQPGARTGVGVWLMPMDYLGTEEAVATRLDAQAVDARIALLESLPAGARFSGLTAPHGQDPIVHLLRELSQRTHVRDLLLVHTIDLLLLALEMDEREHFWQSVLLGLPYPHAKLILAVPEKATDLFSWDQRRRYGALMAEGPLE